MYGSYPSGVTDSQIKWSLKHFDIFNDKVMKDGTLNHHNLPPGSIPAGKIWAYYYDVYMTDGNAGYIKYKDFVTSKGLDVQKTFLHAKKNYRASYRSGSGSADVWKDLEKFGVYEGVNGVLRTADEVTFTDLTAAAYAGAVTFKDTVYFGHEEPFAEINFTFSTFGKEIRNVWEYWNGSAWKTLAVKDNTHSFAQNGQISFIPPSMWQRLSVNRSRNNYYVRVRITGHDTSPVSTSIKSEKWLSTPPVWTPSKKIAQYEFVAPSAVSNNNHVYLNTTGGTSGNTEPVWPAGSGATVIDGTITWKETPRDSACRGWDPASSTIVNAGTELEFNPAPPAYATAKFPHQARITGWNNRNFVNNPADKQIYNGKPVRIWALFVAQEVADMLATGSVTGMMADDATSEPSSSIATALTDFADRTSNTWISEVRDRYGEITAEVHALYPNAKVGCNTDQVETIVKGDFNTNEQLSVVPNTGGSAYNIRFEPSLVHKPRTYAYDDYLPGGYLDGKIGVMMYTDPHLVRPPTINYSRKGDYFDTGNVPWDRANRGPLAALTKHLIGWNPNTYFRYWGSAGAFYNMRDVVNYIDPASPTTRLTTAISKKTTYGPKIQVSGADFSGFPKSMTCMAIGEGDKLDVIMYQTVTKTSSKTLLVNGVVNFDHAIGEKVRFCKQAHLAAEPAPPLEQVVNWTTWFPAMGVDFGAPDVNGHNGGKRDMQWIKASALGGVDGIDNVWRRDWANAVILHRPGAYANVTAKQYDTPGTIHLGGTYYPLQADGYTLPPTTAITLRAGEGAILMKRPVPERRP